MELRKCKDWVQLRRVKYIPVEHTTVTDTEGRVHQVKVKGTGQGRNLMFASYNVWDLKLNGQIPTDLPEVTQAQVDKDQKIKGLTSNERQQFIEWINTYKAESDALRLKSTGGILASLINEVAADLKGAGIDQLRYDQILNALDALKAVAKKTGLEQKTVSTRRKEAEVRNQ